MDPRHRLALDDADEDTRPWQAAGSVPAHKLARFAGTNRKSKFELEREAEQERERAAKEDAARAYDEFVEAFGGDEEVGPSQGGRPRIGGAGRSKGKGFVRAGGDEKYDPLAGRPEQQTGLQTSGPAAGPSAPAAAPRAPRAMLQPQAAAFKRAGDTFLEQLKRDQAAREERLKQTAGRVGSSITALAAREHAPVLTGSYDVGDPLTTNIHVGGLPANVTEQSLGKLFAQFGPVGSVKIMWPRLDSGQLASMGGRKLGGFVAFLRRPDAERAAKEMDGAEWGNSTLKIGWGKAVPIPATALYELEEGVDETFLVAVAKRVRDNGREFEQVLKERERDNMRFAFLRDDKVRSYHYFKMLIDPSYEPPLVAQFDDEVRLFVLHPFGRASIYSSDSEEDSDDERVGKGRLSPLAERRFACLLRGLTSSRDKIARGMAFALEHADCASYIADLLVCSLTIDTTPVPRKLARLHLVSDILHNSAASVPNAWVYRSLFEHKLPAVFDHLGDIYLSFPGRLKAEQFRGLVEKVLDVWANDWILFTPSVIDDFKRRLAGLDVLPASASEDALPPAGAEAPRPDTAMRVEPAAELEPAQEAAAPDAAAGPSAELPRAFKPSFKAAAFAPAEEPEADPAPAPAPDAEVDVDGAPIELGMEEEEEEGDVDGAPVGDVDVDGEEVDGAPIEVDDVDGAPVALEDDVDGAPLPQAEEQEGKRQTETVVLDEEGDNDGEAMEMGSDDDIFQ
ncbi:hypothetical protein DMC30DRAFT_380285 [Rhodotorula diobovata]|uniref:U2-associated protein SR140 n=1 Tax=Rhodotorula diobovata TaxID=5288 RepID=A0A5C5FQS4_9BASI|nr:hypothetical protein DMC30DRAFT_380285 [Rhodotorula diobovata]